MVKRFLCAVVGTAILAVLALIQAEKNVMFVVRVLSHEEILVLRAALT
jgi:hypothetical protein